MADHFALTDEQFEQQFKDASLDPALFSHEAHIRLAWIHISKYGADVAAEHLCRQIAVFDATHDDGTNYNKTVTVAAVKAVHHFMDKSSASTCAEFIQENPRLIFNFKDLIRAHYSQNIFKDEVARHTYVPPDLASF